MSNITATINLSSTTLFPSGTLINVSQVEQVNGDSDFQLIEIEVGKTSTIFGPSVEADLSNTVYFYAQAKSTNVANIEIYIQDQDETQILVGILRPSDFMWIPLAVYGANVKVVGVNLDVKNTSKINVFWGHRS
jgi:hypothetical protein